MTGWVLPRPPAPGSHHTLPCGHPTADSSLLSTGHVYCPSCGGPLLPDEGRVRSSETWSNCAACGLADAPCWAQIDASNTPCCSACSHSVITAVARTHSPQPSASGDSGTSS